MELRRLGGRAVVNAGDVPGARFRLRSGVRARHCDGCSLLQLPFGVPVRFEDMHMLLELHRCKICGTRWLLWPESVHGGGWNVADKYSKPGGCCDNALMGDQIEHLRDFDLGAAPPVVSVSQPPSNCGWCGTLEGPFSACVDETILICGSCAKSVGKFLKPLPVSPPPQQETIEELQRLYDCGGITFATYQAIEIDGGTKVICRLCAKGNGEPHANDCAVGTFEVALKASALSSQPAPQELPLVEMLHLLNREIGIIRATRPNFPRLDPERDATLFEAIIERLKAPAVSPPPQPTQDCGLSVNTGTGSTNCRRPKGHADMCSSVQSSDITPLSVKSAYVEGFNAARDTDAQSGFESWLHSAAKHELGVVSPPPTQEPQDEQLEQCPNCGGMSINATTASIRCCLDCGRDVTPILWVRATLSSPQAPQEGK